MIIVELPWPPRDLSPNVRRHWAVVANAKKRYRRDCKYATLAAGGKLDAEVKEVRLDYVFHPPGNYGYDKDNLIASLKSGVDGISDAIGIDDKYFHFGEVEIGAVSKGGKVRVFISNDTTEESDAQTTNSTVSAQIQRVEAAQAFAAGRDRRLATQDQHGRDR